jgi:hypothetical protein
MVLKEQATALIVVGWVTASSAPDFQEQESEGE